MISRGEVKHAGRGKGIAPDPLPLVGDSNPELDRTGHEDTGVEGAIAVGIARAGQTGVGIESLHPGRAGCRFLPTPTDGWRTPCVTWSVSGLFDITPVLPGLTRSRYVPAGTSTR